MDFVDDGTAGMLSAIPTCVVEGEDGTTAGCRLRSRLYDD